MSKKLPLIELFGPTLQGEGALIGNLSMFLRFGGCGHRCSWCDSMHAVDPKQVKKNAHRLLPVEIVANLKALHIHRSVSGLWVTLTGGDPVIHDLTELVQLLKGERYRVTVETQGDLWHDWLEDVDLVTVSPKPPSSGMAEKFDLAILQKYTVRLEGRLHLKIVVFDDLDLDWAMRVFKKFRRLPFYITAGTPMGQPFSTDLVLASYRNVAEKVLARSKSESEYSMVRVLPQLHTLLWGQELGR